MSRYNSHPCKSASHQRATKNPYPQIITAARVAEAEEENRGIDRDNGFVYDNDSPEEYDLSIDYICPDENKRKGLLSRFGLNGQANTPISDKFLALFQNVRREFYTSPRWEAFRTTILPRFKGVNLDTAVCLGAATLYNSETYQAATLFVYELVVFHCIVESIETQQGGSRLRTIFQDPRFSAADARLVAALGGKAVRHPHARKYIGPKTFLFALFLPHNAMWNFALRDAEPALFLGNDVLTGRGKLMVDAWIAAKSDGGRDLSEVHDVYRRSQKFASTRVGALVPAVEVPMLGEIFRGVTFWSPRRCARTQGVPRSLDSPKDNDCLQKDGFSVVRRRNRCGRKMIAVA